MLPTSSSPLHLLIVDDSETDREILRRLLSGRSSPRTEITEADTLAAGREQLLHQAPEVCLLDVHLPDGNGIELLAWIREHYPQVAVIVLTSDPDLHWDEQARALGADGYLLKSELTALLITRTIHYARRNRKALQALQASTVALDPAPALICMCIDCQRVRDAGDHWLTLETYLRDELKLHPTRGVCPLCYCQRMRRASGTGAHSW